MISQDNGFHEVVSIVRSAASSARRLADSFGYEIIHQGTPDPAALASLGIPHGWAGEEVLVGDPAQQRGFMRLISFAGHETAQMRPGGSCWDTGGIFDINIRALHDIEGVGARMNKNGFVAYTPVTRWQFGPLDVKEHVFNDSDGIGIAIMERMAPPLEGHETVVNQCSYIFNSTQSVPDFAAARAFYVDVLGWKPIQETEWTHEDGNNCIGLPPSVASTCPIKVGIYQSNGLNDGSVEIIELAVDGLDMSRGRPPERGIACLRFPVSDAQAFLDKSAAAGCEIVDLTEAEIAPYGKLRIGGVITPWGARLDVFETL